MLGRSGAPCTSPRSCFLWLIGWGVPSDDLSMKDSSVLGHCYDLKWRDVVYSGPSHQGGISSSLDTRNSPAMLPSHARGRCEASPATLFPSEGGPEVWLRGRGLRSCEVESSLEMPVRSRSLLRSREVSTSTRDTGSVGLWLGDDGPGCPPRTRT
jgi:hypothetical protein